MGQQWPDALSSALSRYGDFSGRSRRRDYWLFVASYSALTVPTWTIGWSLIAGAVVVWAAEVTVLAAWWVLVATTLSLALLVPSYALAARRLQDLGRSPVWLLLNVVPYANYYVVYLCALDGTPGANQYGPDPKGRSYAPQPYLSSPSPWPSSPPQPYPPWLHRPPA
ncbi:DUF805 domain-containing protein [Aquipuribacter sp. SD81]|uniref:DUF805 domain-containing protein n=1 Tax=Aquipuribacter sp. SD81 TaxID=3127703 RepID=UPI003017F506